MPIPEMLKGEIRKNDKNFIHLNLSGLAFRNTADFIELEELLEKNNYIKSLDLSRNNISDSKNMAFLSRLSHRLTFLNLSQNNIDDEGVRQLFCNRNSTLARLDVSLNCLTDACSMLLLAQLQQGVLKNVKLDENSKISAEVLLKIKAAGECKDQSLKVSPELNLSSVGSLPDHLIQSNKIVKSKPIGKNQNLSVPSKS